MSGTTPPGTRNEREAAAWVRNMFGQVAPRYDLLNHLLSFNIDKHWRSKTVKRLHPVLQQPGARVLDLCCGTGDLALALQKNAPAQVYASDFCHPMLTAAAQKTGNLPLFEADGLQLPLPDAELDLITIAFGFRNFASYERGLEELRRVLKPGGTLAILEFSTPPNRWFAGLYAFYSNRVLPRIGALVSGAREAYRYLPASVVKFPDADGLSAMMTTARFREVSYQRMTFGIVALHTGIR